MLRLLQGDVGSGKTAVAAYALAAVARAGLQGALLAPTDLLARQHLETIGALLEPLGHRRHAADRLAERTAGAQGPRAPSRSGQAAGRRRHPRAHPGVGLVRATSASWSSTSSIASASPSATRSRARPAARSPHVLLMTATPIPRTLGQVRLRRPRRLGPADAAGRPRSRSGPGSAAPTTSPARGRRSATRRPPAGARSSSCRSSTSRGVRDRAAAVARRVRGRSGSREAARARCASGLVHGRLKAADRDAEMTRFRDGELDVLVGHDRRRGRRGRAGGDDDGHRVGRPVRARPAPPAARPGRPRDRRVVLRPRLRQRRRGRRRPGSKAVAEIRDGFELAERDFELRREGDVLGLAQSGLPRLRVASLAGAGAPRARRPGARATPRRCSTRAAR